MTFSRSGSGVCAARGFKAGAAAAGLKESGNLDIGIIFTETPAAVAGVFTKNLSAAAPVEISRERVASGKSHGVVVNAGCANACTGGRGIEDASAMTRLAASAVGVNPEDMLVCSTGLIGAYLPMDKVEAGIKAAASSLEPNDESISSAILTTDTRPKKSALIHSDGWSIGGIAKGAGMIAPNMATMLGFMTTDAVVPARVLQSILSEVVRWTFNRITIDGDTSTNDTVLLFANGASGISPDEDDLARAIENICRSLAEKIVADGEGATKFVRVRVRGAASDIEAETAARTVATSTLVKAALWGRDPNWGRVAAALGRSGVSFRLEDLSIAMSGVPLFEKGVPADKKSLARAHYELDQPEVTIVCDLFRGNSSAEVLTTDLSPKYVEFNGDYST